MTVTNFLNNYLYSLVIFEAEDVSRNSTTLNSPAGLAGIAAKPQFPHVPQLLSQSGGAVLPRSEIIVKLFRVTASPLLTFIPMRTPPDDRCFVAGSAPSVRGISSYLRGFFFSILPAADVGCPVSHSRCCPRTHLSSLLPQGGWG